MTIAVSADGQTIAIARSSGGIEKRFARIELRTVNALAFSPDGKTIASGGDDRTAVLWDVATAKATRTLKGHDLTVASLAFSPDGLLLASASGNASVVLWNVPTGKVERVLR